MSASPSDRAPIDWGGNLPSIPSKTGVFWPSIGVGILCAMMGLYLIFTPVPEFKERAGEGATPLPVSTANPEETRPIEGARILRCALVDSKDSTFALGLEEFAQSVNTRSNGQIVVEILPGGLVDGRKMGERELVEAVRKGELAMCISTTSPLSNFNHNLDIFDLPFLFESYAHAEQVLDGPIGEELLNSLQKHNLKGLGYLEVGFRVISASVPLPDFESFSGKKIRVMESVTLSRFMRAIGGDPVPAPVDKIYAMGKEGYIDGADRSYPTYWDFRLYEVHQYISETRHAYSVKMILIDDKLFQELPEPQRMILIESARIASNLQRKKQRDADESVKKMALEKGITIHEIDEKERVKFKKASVELYDEYRKNQSKELLDRVEEAAVATTGR